MEKGEEKSAFFLRENREIVGFVILPFFSRRTNGVLSLDVLREQKNLTDKCFQFFCRLGGVAQEMKCDFLLVIFYFVLFKNFLVRTGLYFLILFNSAFFLSSIKRSTF